MTNPTALDRILALGDTLILDRFAQLSAADQKTVLDLVGALSQLACKHGRMSLSNAIDLLLLFDAISRAGISKAYEGQHKASVAPSGANGR